MKEKILKATADSLEEARKTISKKVPNGLSVLHEEVISDGKPKTQKGTAETIEAAFNKAVEFVPDNGVITDKCVITNPEEKQMIVKAIDEKTAKTEAEDMISESQFVLDVMLKTKGKDGFLGIGRQPDQFEIRLRQDAFVEVKYVQKAEIHVKIGKKPYKFRNRRYYSGKPISGLLGVILLAPIGEAKEIAKSKVFIGTVEDTIGAYIDGISKKPIIALAHPKTDTLFLNAQAGIINAQEEIINEGIEYSLKNTKGAFPPKPVKKNFYLVRAMRENEKTMDPFLVLVVYK